MRRGFERCCRSHTASDLTGWRLHMKSLTYVVAVQDDLFGLASYDSGAPRFLRETVPRDLDRCGGNTSAESSVMPSRPRRFLIILAASRGATIVRHPRLPWTG